MRNIICETTGFIPGDLVNIGGEAFLITSVGCGLTVRGIHWWDTARLRLSAWMAMWDERFMRRYEDLWD